MFVLDCSVTLAWCFDDEKEDYADSVLTRLLTETAIVPVLWHLEVMNVLLVGQRKGRISANQMGVFLNLVQKLDIHTDSKHPDIEDADFLTLARRHQLSAYDTAYLSLTLRERLPVATLDKKLKEVAQGLGVYLD